MTDETEKFAKDCIELENNIRLLLSLSSSDRVKTAVLLELLVPLITKQDNPKGAFKQLCDGLKRRVFL